LAGGQDGGRILTAGASVNQTRRFADTNVGYVCMSLRTFDLTPASATVDDDDEYDDDDDDDDGSDVSGGRRR